MKDNNIETEYPTGEKELSYLLKGVENML